MAKLLSLLASGVVLALVGPSEAGGDGVPRTSTDLVDWLVARGDVDAEAAAGLAPVPILEVPSVPLAVMAPLPPLGCTGPFNTVGDIVNPHATVPACLIAAAHGRPVWLASLVSVGVEDEEGISFSVLDGVDGNGRAGFLILTCPPTGAILDFEQQNLIFATSGCGALKGGSDPSSWGFWEGFGGAFGDLGVWDATVLLK